MSEEIKSLIETQGKAFEAFKAEMDVLKKRDAVAEEKLAKIEKTLDEAVEAKAKIEKALSEERKEREELEIRLSRRGQMVPGSEDAATEVKAFNLLLAAHAKETGGDRPSDLGVDGVKAYRAAQQLYLRKGANVLSADERKAMMVGGDPQGGYLVTPDMGGRIITKVFETSPIRQIANVVTISTDAMEGIEDLNEAGAGWVGETGTRSETTTPDIGKWRIPVHEMYAEPRATQKVIDDAALDIEAYVANKVAERFARLENAAFVTGDGVAKPRGFADYTTAADSGDGVTWGTVGHIATGTSGDFPASNPADKLFDLVGLLKDAYLPGARFVTRRSVITKVRKFKDGTTGMYLWQPALAAGVPESLLGYPITRAEDLAALGASSKSLYFGNFGIAYQIIDRIGIRVLNDPYTAKPYVKFYTTKRTGGGLLNFEAIKAMVFG